jgi:PTH1 family peptidyl-tRNA hydrolase
VKPLTYMNLSGQAVAPLARQWGIPADHVLVLADDLDMAVGRTRLKPKGSAGGHNGHKSLIGSLGTNEYPRLKIGIGASDGSTIDHVLGRFDRDELEPIKLAISRAADGVEVAATQGLEPAMNIVNV